MPAPHLKRRLIAFVAALAMLIVTPLAVVASDVFTDVPSTNTFHDDITWLANAGVTKGCNPPANTLYCPSDNVTREQMAAFMHRLAVNKVVDAATAQEADHAASADSATDSNKLGGEGPSAYLTYVNADACSFSECTDSAAFAIASQASVTVNLRASGVLEIASSFTAFGSGGGTNVVQMWAAIDQTQNGGCGSWFFAPGQAVPGSFATEDNNNDDAASLATTTAVNISGGSHTIHLCAIGADNIDATAASLVTQWSQGGSGLALASADSTATFDAATQARFEEDFAGANQ
ncbi:MAG: S-layer homology domain-containing protein [Acidimicrobiia bacterium]